jgi:hypothetical protein
VSALPNTWAEALAEYHRLRALSDTMRFSGAEDDAAIDAYCAAMDHLIERVPALSPRALMIKLDLALERSTPSGADGLVQGHVIAIRQDLMLLEEGGIASVWWKLWRALHCQMDWDHERAGDVLLWIPEPSIISDGLHGDPGEDETIWFRDPQPPHLRINTREEWRGAFTMLHIILREMDGLSAKVMACKGVGLPPAKPSALPELERQFSAWKAAMLEINGGPVEADDSDNWNIVDAAETAILETPVSGARVAIMRTTIALQHSFTTQDMEHAVIVGDMPALIAGLDDMSWNERAMVRSLQALIEGEG